MSLTTALFTALTGMNTHSQSLDVIGNNIANVNTVGFKGSRALFETQLSSSLTFGSAPSADSGGTNPTQIGLGVTFGGTQKNMTNGAIQPTGVNTDLAVEGNGFFIVEQGDAEMYTRSGQFDLDSDRKLVTPSGAVLKGFGVDSNFNVVPNVLQDVEIPIGTLTIAEATRNVDFVGNLNASGDVAFNGSQNTSDALVDGGAAAVTGATALTDTRSAATPATPLFTTGDVITIDRVEKGGKALGATTFEVGPANTTNSDTFGTTLADFIAFIEDSVGIDPSVVNGSGVTPGVTISAGGEIVVEGNHGLANDIILQTSDISSSGSPSQPFVFTKTRDADGESVRTTVEVFDSLGTPISYDLTLVLDSKTVNGTTWQYYAESYDDTDVDVVLGTGTLDFNGFGELSSVNNPNVSINRTNTGAIDPLGVLMSFSGPTNQITALTDVRSTLAAVSQDGTGIGTLENFGIGENGIISGSFSNGLTRTLGQVALATFTNPEGLVDAGSNIFNSGPNSGLAVAVAPQTLGGGRIIAGALELSNVDLSQEFVNLISVTTGFTASSRVISTSDELIRNLLSS